MDFLYDKQNHLTEFPFRWTAGALFGAAGFIDLVFWSHDTPTPLVVTWLCLGFLLAGFVSLGLAAVRHWELRKYLKRGLVMRYHDDLKHLKHATVSIRHSDHRGDATNAIAHLPNRVLVERYFRDLFHNYYWMMSVQIVPRDCDKFAVVDTIPDNAIHMDEENSANPYLGQLGPVTYMTTCRSVCRTALLIYAVFDNEDDLTIFRLGV